MVLKLLKTVRLDSQNNFMLLVNVGAEKLEQIISDLNPDLNTPCSYYKQRNGSPSAGKRRSSQTVHLGCEVFINKTQHNSKFLGNENAVE